GTDVRSVAHRLAPPRAVAPATLLLREGAGHGLRRKAVAVELDVPGPDDASGWDRVTVEEADLADEVLSFGADAYVEGPEELRDEVVRRLRAVVEAS
ncbi:MAG: WYL domain-containing protein, partial [Nocardioidaceae bacterium]|nr:WYL domain-containing protein [Nocardioidaceae bacterium]